VNFELKCRTVAEKKAKHFRGPFFAAPCRPVGLRKFAHEGIKERYPLKVVILLLLASPS